MFLAYGYEAPENEKYKKIEKEEIKGKNKVKEYENFPQK